MVKYIDIERLKDKYRDAFTPNEHITITEKIDGSNLSLYCENGEIKAASRRRELDYQNTLRGAWEFSQSLDKKIFNDLLGERYILFGEWLVKNKISYPADVMGQFYVFDLYDKEKGVYTPWFLTKAFANKLGLKTVPLFFDGEFTSWDEIYSYVGRTEMGATPCGEGIVIKSQDRLDNRRSETPQYVKIVSNEFSEVMKRRQPKEVSPEEQAAK